jgi:hypothetical protein
MKEWPRDGEECAQLGQGAERHRRSRTEIRDSYLYTETCMTAEGRWAWIGFSDGYPHFDLPGVTTIELWAGLGAANRVGVTRFASRLYPSDYV